MDFRDTPKEAVFRTEVREFIKREHKSDAGTEAAQSAYQAAAQGGAAAMDAYKGWMKKLSSRGWVAPAWPKEYGGAGMTIMEQFIFNEELAQARAPRPGGIGIAMAGPTIIVYGTEDQKKQHLSGMLSGEMTWCQGFSEPASGSDLASLQTKAVRDGDDYVINGQKIWTSGAQYADRMILLARTDPEAPKHKGISYFLLDMKSPGVSVRPLVNMAGTSGFNEVFFDNVRVPRKDLLGEENRGWYVGTTTLDFERSSIGTSIAQGQAIEDLIEWVKTSKNGPLHPTVRLELAERAIEANAARLMSYQVISMQNRGLVPNHEASAVKIYAAELNQRITNTSLKVTGLFGQLDPSRKDGENATMRYSAKKGRFVRTYLQAVASTIAGGTSEINRTIIATRGLGLPRG